MAADRKSEAEWNRGRLSPRGDAAGNYGRGSWAGRAPYFVIATSAAAFAAPRPLEVGFVNPYGIVVKTPSLENVVFIRVSGKPV